MQVYSVFNVFTPSKPATLAFVERPSLNENLVNAIRTPGKQVVVYGHSGSGKTTLLTNKLRQLYESHITSRCLISTTIDQLILDAFDQLNPFYEKTRNAGQTDGLKASIEKEYFGIKTALEASQTLSSTTTRERFLPPQLSPATLARLMGGARACWVIEDFHKVPESEKTKLSQVMKVFMDTAADFPEVKIIAIGAVDTARQVVQYDPEMKNRIAEIHVPLMTNDESREILTKAEQLLGLQIPADIKNKIVHYANGLASVCHHLGLNLCHAKGVQVTAVPAVVFGMQDFQKAFDGYVSEMSDTLKSAFDKAFRKKKAGKFDNCRLIIQALGAFDQEGATFNEVFRKIRETTPNYPSGNLTLYITQLTRVERGGIIRYDLDSGRYSFADPIYRAFSVALFKKPETQADIQLDWSDVRMIKIDSDTLFHAVFLSELAKESVFKASQSASDADQKT